MNNYVHLHNHTDYSLLDGACRSETYVKKAKELGMTALGITDHGNMFGVLDHYMACKKEGIVPVIGQEFYVAKDSRLIKDTEHRECYHLVLFAMNNTGYHNLMELSSIGWTEGKYYKPRIDHQCLKEHNEGLICLSACLAGEIPQLLLHSETEKAYETARWYKSVFGNRYYIEIQNHDIADEIKVLPLLIKLARTLDIKLVATNDVHYCNKEDALSHEVLLCIGTKGKLKDEKHFKFETNEFYLKTQEEMENLFSEYPDALENTAEIANRCAFDIDFPKGLLPDYCLPSGYENAAEYLRKLVNDGLKTRFSEYGIDKKLTETLDCRIQTEMATILKMGFEGYFLIVQDYVMWAKNNKIQVGPGRGSGAGSLVAYCIGITNVDPIKYDLLFERFLNPDRVSLPDFDVDFSNEDRSKVIDYVVNKYGSTRVGKIATFSMLKPRQVVADVARVLGIDSNTAHQITSLIPQRVEVDDDGESQMVDVTLSLALETVPELEAYKKDETFSQLFDISLKLENLSRQVGIHPCGIVIGKTELKDYVPLFVDSKTDTVACQYSKTFIEDYGLVKMDLLGLKTLTLIDNTQKLIRETEPDFDINNISFEDDETYKMMARGDSMMVFQFESDGMQQNLKRLNPSKFSDLYDMNSLYRPGPMDFIPSYIAGKNDESCIEYPDSNLVELLKPTHGVIVYQEQVMKVAQIIAGFTLAQADELRKIMGKKQVQKLPAMKEKFINGAIALGRTEQQAVAIFEMLAPFAQYGFNKSHSVCYSDLAYRTAYLKCHYPAQFFAANLTNELGDSKKFRKYLSYIRTTDIEIVPPDVNKSSQFFCVDGKRILFGLAGVKGLGENTAKLIIEERETNGKFSSVYDFLVRTRGKGVTSLVMTSLIYSGAFDSFGYNRRTLYLNLEDMIKEVSKQIKRQNAVSEDFELTIYEDYGHSEKLEKEKTTLGFYVSGHPLDLYKEKWRRHMKLDLSKPDRIHKNHPYNIIGMVKEIRKVTTKTGRRMAFVTVEDYNGELSVTVFPELWNSYSDVIKEGKIIAFLGSFNEYKGTLGFVASSVCSDIAYIRSITSSRVILEIVRGASSKDIMKAIADNPGDTELLFSVYEHREDYDNMLEDHRKPKIIRPRESYYVKVSPKLAQDLLQGQGVLGIYIE